MTFIAIVCAPNIGYAATQPADAITLRAGTVAPEGTPWESLLKTLRKRLKKESKQRLKLKLYLGGQKGDEKSLVRQARDGRIEMIGVSTAALATEVPALQVLELPFLFASTEEADYVLDNHLYEPVKKLAAKYGFVFYQWGENGWQNLGSRGKAITSPKDLKGLKIRSQESKVHLATWKGLGASPVEMSVSEVLPALKTGLVDGVGQTPLFTFAAGWHQGLKSYTLSRHVYQPGAVVYSKKFFDKLSSADQKLLLAHVKAYTVRGRRGVRAIEPGLLKNFTNFGIEVVTLTQAQKESFVQAARKVRQEYLKTASQEAKDLLALIDTGIQAFRSQQASKTP